VRRLIDRLPGASIGVHRRLIDELQISDATTRRLRQQAYQNQDHIQSLYRDIRLLARKVPLPTIDRAIIEDSHCEMAMETRRDVRVTYQEQRFSFALDDYRRRSMTPVELSAWGHRALEHAAHEIASEAAKTHAQHIIDATRYLGIFKP